MPAIQLRLRAALCGIALAGAALAQTTVNIPCAADNTLYETIFGDASNGAGNSTFVGTNSFGSIRRAVMRFDVASVVPAGSRILTARLDLYVTMTPVSGPPGTSPQPISVARQRIPGPSASGRASGRVSRCAARGCVQPT